MRRVQCLLFALTCAGGATASGCIGGGVFYKEHLTGPFSFWAVDGLAENSLVHESPDGRGAIVVIEPTVFAAGFDDRFIIVGRHPRQGAGFDRATTEYYVVTIRDQKVFGPATSEAFPALRAKLGVPAALELSRVIEQLR